MEENKCPDDARTTIRTVEANRAAIIEQRKDFRMKYYRFILISLIALLFSCEKNKTPLSAENNSYTSHDYEWEVDTLHASEALQVLMRGVWGTDENNVWVIGHSDETKYQVWHWEGTTWINLYLLFPGHPHSLTAIYGFSANDIWVVGTDFQNYPNTEFRSFIIHYNGTGWDLIEEVDAPWCFSVFGTSSNNLFVGSDSGLILHYDGHVWAKQSTNTRSQILSIWGFSQSEVYAAGLHHGNVQPIDSTFYYFYKYDGQNWTVLDSALDYPYAPKLSFGFHLWGDEQNNLYSVGSDGLYKWEDNSWLRLRDETLYAINGSRWNNLFVGGWMNQLLHFNGNDWFGYEAFLDNYKEISAIWCNENNTFVISLANNQSFIYRGNLKKSNQRR